ncbi:hypothetical protein F7O44_12775 [Phytoactinopolyspora sp. XMNu-373]|uniref:DUF308 domain-containing protein n=1 Tax=Phytoactinopolyspora mesophila TaxID=2650750 RepID=A0A7K3M3R3_9ACTN|nr:hypothetical protein [Phytoactinopolyspora mesophila]
MIEPTAAARVFVHVGIPLLGAAAGLLLRWLAGRATSVAWMPFQGPLELIDSLPEPYVTIGAMIAGLVAGWVIALLAESEALHVSVADHEVTLGRDGSAQRVSRTSATAVFVEGKDLVILGTATEELARSTFDMDDDDVRRLGEVFQSHAWPWCAEGDPHRHQYRRWVDGAPDLPPGPNAILRAREKTLKQGDKDDAAQLRTELAALDVVVRDEPKGRQFWRYTTNAQP